MAPVLTSCCHKRLPKRQSRTVQAWMKHIYCPSMCCVTYLLMPDPTMLAVSGCGPSAVWKSGCLLSTVFTMPSRVSLIAWVLLCCTTALSAAGRSSSAVAAAVTDTNATQLDCQRMLELGCCTCEPCKASCVSRACATASGLLHA